MIPANMHLKRSNPSACRVDPDPTTEIHDRNNIPHTKVSPENTSCHKFLHYMSLINLIYKLSLIHNYKDRFRVYSGKYDNKTKQRYRRSCTSPIHDLNTPGPHFSK